MKFNDDWIPVQDNLPGVCDPTSFSDYVLVSVDCDNGLRFVDIDRYNRVLRTWEHGDGRTVTHWQPLPLPALRPHRAV